VNVSHRGDNLQGGTFIVTGGAGFIGSRLVRRLLEKGCKVIVIDNFHTGSISNLNEVLDKVKIVEGRSRKISELKEEVSGVFHLGIYSSSPMYRKNPRLVSEIVEDAIAILEYCKEAGCPLVYASTSSLYNGNPLPYREDMPVFVTDYYTEARYYLERLSELYRNMHGVRSTGLRLFSVYGENEIPKGKYANMVSQFIWYMLKGEAPVIYGDGSQTRDFIYVEDVVDAFLVSMHSEKDGIFNVGTGIETSFNQVFNRIKEVLGSGLEPKYVPCPIKNYVYRTKADTTKAETQLGFKARTSLEDGIRKLISYYKEKIDKLPLGE